MTWQLSLHVSQIHRMETPTRGYNLKVPVNGFELSYDDIGEGNLPIIFLHGFPFDKTMWRLQLDFLKPTHRVLACDIRGFGKSKDEESPLSMDLFAEDLILFMDALTIGSAIICGLSMGGFIALNALNKYPDRFEALILCDTQCIADTAEVKEKREQVIEEIKLGGVTKFNEGFIKSVFCKESFSHKKELVKNLHRVVFANSQQVIINGLTALAERSETCSTLDDIKIPTLIICGREDEVTPLAQSEFMQHAIKDSTLQVIDNAGHVSNLEQADIFNKHLTDFLGVFVEAGFEPVNGSKRMV